MIKIGSIVSIGLALVGAGIALATSQAELQVETGSKTSKAAAERSAVDSGVAQRTPTVSGNFTVLTYNVAGLPFGLSSSNPHANMRWIGQKISDVDVVHVQEDFNYHATLYDNDNHPYRTTTSGGVLIGDGLNTLSRFPFTDSRRISWKNCNGTDCLTPKGFTYMRVRIAEAAYLDFYNVHANAGVAPNDISARKSNITQLSQYIADNSMGNAVILMGDFNCRYTRSGDNVRDLVANNGLTDTWIELVRNGEIPVKGSEPLICSWPNVPNSCEVVDKIFYRDSEYIDLTPTRYQLDDPGFVTEDGTEPLSDHFPVRATFEYSIKTELKVR